jgi:hypothetical protein
MYNLSRIKNWGLPSTIADEEAPASRRFLLTDPSFHTCFKRYNKSRVGHMTLSTVNRNFTRILSLLFFWGGGQYWGLNSGLCTW